jgi:hypothetical protein
VDKYLPGADGTHEEEEDVHAYDPMPVITTCKGVESWEKEKENTLNFLGRSMYKFSVRI